MDIGVAYNRIIRHTGQINGSCYASAGLKAGSQVTGKCCIPIQAPEKKFSRCVNLGYCIPCFLSIIIHIVVITGLSIFIIRFIVYLTLIVPGITSFFVNQYRFRCILICQTNGYDRRCVPIIFRFSCDIIKISSAVKRNCNRIFLNIQSIFQNLDIGSGLYGIIIRSRRCNQQSRWSIRTCFSCKLICFFLKCNSRIRSVLTANLPVTGCTVNKTTKDST